MKNSRKNSILFAGLFIFGILLSSSFTATATNAVSYDGDELYELKCDGKTTEAKTKEGKCGEGKCGEATSKEAKTGAAVKSDKNAKTTEGKCGEGKCGVS